MTLPPDQDQVDFICDVLDKRYVLYTWCEEKINTLATMNSVLLGVLIAVTGRFYKSGDRWSVASLAVCSLALLSSLLIVLWHIVPTMRSGTLPKTSRNLRSVVGVSRFDSNDDYMNALLDADALERFRSVVDQVRGMNKNILRNQAAIRAAVIADMVGLAGFAGFVVSYSFS